MFVLMKKKSSQTEVKKSRFIAHAVPVKDADEAVRTIAALSDQAATHNCFAYRIGDQYRFSDDGEPGGTAGRPILAAIEKQEVDRCLVLVTRFFGGIKLGAGGLARAYGGAAAECLRAADKEVMRVRVTKTLRAPFDTIGEIYPLLERFEAEKRDERYEAEGVLIEMALPLDNLQPFKAALADATRARAAVMD
jgi:uncharacterized YigZ family protein